MKRLLLILFVVLLPIMLIAQEAPQTSPIGFGLQLGLIQDASGANNLAFNIAFGPMYQIANGTEAMLAIGAWKCQVQDGKLYFDDQEAVFAQGVITQMIYNGWYIQGKMGLAKIDYTGDSETPVTYAEGYAGMGYMWKIRNIGYGFYAGTDITQLQTSFLAGLRFTFH